MLTDPIIDRFSQPLPVVGYECLCGAHVSDDEGAECSACDAVICEQCEDLNRCRHEDCERSYCDKCAEKFLPPDAAGICVTCGSPWRHQRAAYQRVVAAMGFRRTA